ncbi:MAG: Mitochondrial presequence protease [Trizodia sp. TS-e1964]|nr:MAG: Mitochondrial presequence protease [Trizodia sp. TS-e1964]
MLRLLPAHPILQAKRLSFLPSCSRCIREARLRTYASVTDLARYPKQGEKLQGFTLIRAEHVPELELTAIQLKHDKTGADYLHVAREDKNNVFSIGFKTNPPDDTGIPHILEHTTLCGSKKQAYSPDFYKLLMLPRSLSNFMNAFTSSDYTSYPFATTNRQDFKNLMSVYLDATLHPLLKENDFTQEGWRVGPKNPKLSENGELQEKGDDQLVFKGVVYNEMKGQMSDAGYLYYIRFQDHIFPAIHNSGGDPQKITDLTHDQLKSFHANHYHPSNAKIFTYGDMPLRDHLKDFGSRLDLFSKIKQDLEIRLPIKLENGPIDITVKGPIDPLVDADMQYKTSTSWLLNDTSNVLETFSIGILSSLLLDGYGSPLYRALIESGLGPEWSPNTGYDSSGKIGILSIGLTGVKETNLPLIKETIQKQLAETLHAGFDRRKVEGLLHQMELGLKHKTAHFGMGLLQRLKPGWFNGVDPFDSLAWEKTVSAFKKKYDEGGYLEGLLEKYLLNDNTFTFTMEPSTTYAEDIAAEEQSRLQSKISDIIKQTGSEQEARERLKLRELELLKVQEKARDEDLSCLPSVHVKDIPRIKDKTELKSSSLGEVKIQWREAPTNGLTYFRAVNTFQNLPDGLRLYIPLFNDAIMRLGTKNQTMEELEDLIKLKTGGITVGYHSSTSPTDVHTSSEGLVLSGYALDRNVPAMYELLRSVIVETDFESPEAENKIKQLLQATASGSADSIAGSGHAYARRYAGASLTPQGRVNEAIGGLTQVEFSSNLAARDPSQGLHDVIQSLKTIQKSAIENSYTMRVALNCGTESTEANAKYLEQFLGSLSSTSSPFHSSTVESYSRDVKTFFPLPYQVYYTAFALETVPYTHIHSAPLQILAQLLTHKRLHHEIREKGGAYGGGAYANGLGGIFGYYSYRDPNPQNTLQIMANTGVWARDRGWTARDIEEAKISVFQSLDAPQSVSQEGMRFFLNGINDTMLQERRERLLDVTAAGVKEVAQEYLVNVAHKGNFVVLGEKSENFPGNGEWIIKDIGMNKS